VRFIYFGQGQAVKHNGLRCAAGGGCEPCPGGRTLVH
jgi:hypothetical protein